jgi:hypothetical protein
MVEASISCLPQRIGCPILRAFCEGWDKRMLRGRASGEEQWHPTLRQRREGWGTRSFVAGREIGFSTVPQMIEICRRFRGRKDVPQGLKPDVCSIVYGPTKVVP